MKIEIEIPDWAAERHLFIFAGIELLAYKKYGDDFISVKKERCNFCGACCENLPQDIHVPIDEKGTCKNLVTYGNTKECKLGQERPWLCNISDPILYKWNDGREEKCCVKYDRIKVK
jgi:hypothetical protein